MTLLPRTIRDQVTEQIRDEVVAGAFPPGQPLREVEFARRFGVSRGPVRDAFLQLAKEGILAYQANRGVTVRQPPKPENRELMVSLRRQIECFVVERGVGSLQRDGLARLVERLENLRVACESADAAAVARRDIEFHETLLVLCGGEDFVPVWKWLCSQMLLAYSRLDDYEQVYQEHAAILEAIRAGKKTAVLASLEANVQ